MTTYSKFHPKFLWLNRPSYMVSCLIPIYIHMWSFSEKNNGVKSIANVVLFLCKNNHFPRKKTSSPSKNYTDLPYMVSCLIPIYIHMWSFSEKNNGVKSIANVVLFLCKNNHFPQKKTSGPSKNYTDLPLSPPPRNWNQGETLKNCWVNSKLIHVDHGRILYYFCMAKSPPITYKIK